MGWLLFRASGARESGESMAGNVCFAVVTGTVCLSYFIYALRKKFALRATLLGLFLGVGTLLLLIMGLADPSQSASLLSTWVATAWIPAGLSMIWILVPPSRRRRR